MDSSLSSSSDYAEMVMHKWFCNAACGSKNECVVAYVVGQKAPICVPNIRM